MVVGGVGVKQVGEEGRVVAVEGVVGSVAGLRLVDRDIGDGGWH